ncbi:MAG: response regulator [Desulfobacterales bacterium]|nr:response regulator [Desulfobacterales bacterium]
MSNLRVLLVDDEEEFVTTLSERLSLRGIETEVAYNGENALAKMNQITPDIVILDVMMPGLSGLDVLKQIKEILPDIPVILLTGRGSTRDGIDGMKQGAFDYLMKPVDIEDLIKKMNEAMKSR